jgi:hypothetical protein
MSQVQPGYRFSNQVPPTSPFFSYIWSCTSLRRLSALYAICIPAALAPTHTSRIGRFWNNGCSVIRYPSKSWLYHAFSWGALLSHPRASGSGAAEVVWGYNTSGNHFERQWFCDIYADKHSNYHTELYYLLGIKYKHSQRSLYLLCSVVLAITVRPKVVRGKLSKTRCVERPKREKCWQHVILDSLLEPLQQCSTVKITSLGTIIRERGLGKETWVYGLIEGPRVWQCSYL